MCSFLRDQGQAGRVTHVAFECRGAREDADLELVFRRVTGTNSVCQQVPLDIVFSPKQANSTGLQVADLIARPTGRGQGVGEVRRVLGVPEAQGRVDDRGDKTGLWPI